VGRARTCARNAKNRKTGQNFGSWRSGFLAGGEGLPGFERNSKTRAMLCGGAGIASGRQDIKFGAPYWPDAVVCLGKKRLPSLFFRRREGRKLGPPPARAISPALAGFRVGSEPGLAGVYRWRSIAPACGLEPASRSTRRSRARWEDAFAG